MDTDTVIRTAENPLLPDPAEAISALETAAQRLADMQVARAEAEPDQVNRQHEQALKRVAATAEGREHLRRQLAEAQSVVDTFTEPTAALGRDYPDLPPASQLSRKNSLETVRTYPQLIARGESRRACLAAFADEGFGQNSRRIAAAEARRVLQAWSDHEVRYTFGPYREPRARRIVKVTRDRIYTESMGPEGPSQITLSRQQFHRDAAGNFLVADPRMHGGLPYAIYSPIGD